MGNFTMGIYDKKSKELKDSGSYNIDEDALRDLINYDIPKGRYGIIEGSQMSDGEYHTIREAEKALRDVEKYHRKNKSTA